MAGAANELFMQAFSSADHPLVRATIAPVAADPAKFAKRFYERLFAHSPGLRVLFPADLSQQQMKLGQTLCTVVAGLERSETVIPLLQALGKAHRGFGAKMAHYHAVGDALIDTLAEVNGDHFTDEAREAWRRLYAWVMKQMTQG